MSQEVRILSTKKLLSGHKQMLLNQGFSVLEENFISTESVPFELENIQENLIFTSQQAVLAVSNHPKVQEIRRNPVFCVGSKTADLLDEVGFTVQETTDYAKDLSKVIRSQYASESFTFFCGNLRRDILPVELPTAGIRFNEIQVYETTLTSVEITAEIDAILFYSPSGVESFLQQNSFNSAICFCIGETTAEAVRDFAEEKQIPAPEIIIANQPTIESTVSKSIHYYKSKLA